MAAKETMDLPPGVRAVLTVDPEVKAVLQHKPAPRTGPAASLNKAMEALKGEQARRDAASARPPRPRRTRGRFVAQVRGRSQAGQGRPLRPGRVPSISTETDLLAPAPGGQPVVRPLAPVPPAPLRAPFGLTYLVARAADTIADTRALPPAARGGRARPAPDRRGDYFAPGGLAAIAGGERPAERELLGRLPEVLAACRELHPGDRTRGAAVLRTLTGAMVEALARFPPEGAGRIGALRRGGRPRPLHLRQCGVRRRVPDRHGARPPAALRPPLGAGTDARARRALRPGASARQRAARPAPRSPDRPVLPAGAELAALGLAPEDLLDPGALPRLRPLLDVLLAEARARLDDGLAYTLAVPRREWRLRLACAWPLLIGLATLGRLARRTRSSTRPWWSRCPAPRSGASSGGRPSWSSPTEVSAGARTGWPRPCEKADGDAPQGPGRRGGPAGRGVRAGNGAPRHPRPATPVTDPTERLQLHGFSVAPPQGADWYLSSEARGPREVVFYKRDGRGAALAHALPAGHRGRAANARGECDGPPGRPFTRPQPGSDDADEPDHAGCGRRARSTRRSDRECVRSETIYEERDNPELRGVLVLVQSSLVCLHPSRAEASDHPRPQRAIRSRHHVPRGRGPETGGRDVLQECRVHPASIGPDARATSGEEDPSHEARDLGRHRPDRAGRRSPSSTRGSRTRPARP